MEKIIQNKEFEEIKNILPTFIKSIGNTNTEIINYLENFKEETFEIKEGENEEESIKRGENILARLLKLVDRRTKIKENIFEMKNIILELNKIILELENKNENDEIIYSEANNKIIEDIIELEKRKRDKLNKLNKPWEEKIKENNETFERRKENLMKQKKKRRRN